jgi:hypothetical protein
LLGYDQPLTWQATEGGMIVTFPSDVKEAPAYALKITAR